MNIRVWSITSLLKLKSDPSYSAAKSGDMAAAEELTERLAGTVVFPVDSNSILIPVIAQEESGRNKLPLALAKKISEQTGAVYETSIIQKVKAFHTGSKATNRLKVVPFVSKSDCVFRGVDFVLVDDHVTFGGTIASLAKFLRSLGGNVSKVISFSNSTHSIKSEDGWYDLTPTPQEISDARARFGDFPETVSGFQYSEMPRRMLRWILQHRSLDSLRKNLEMSGISVKGSYEELSEQELLDIWKEFSIIQMSDILGN